MPLHFSKLSDEGKHETYKRKENDASTFDTLEQMFKEVPKTVPINIEIKDKDSVEAAKKVVELIQKYDRHQTTAIGGEENHV